MPVATWALWAWDVVVVPARLVLQLSCAARMLWECWRIKPATSYFARKEGIYS